MEGVNTLLEALDFWGKKRPSKAALTFLDDTGVEVDALTYSDVLRRSNALAAHLLDKLGLAKGSTCLLVYPPCLDFTVSYLACLRAGVIAVPCFPPDPMRLKKDLHMFEAIQGSSGATVALTSRSYNYAKKMSDIRGMFSGGSAWPELKWVVTDSLVSATAADEDSGRFPVPNPADVAFLQYTSGSTSEPKGVMITHANLSDNMKLILAGLGAVDDTVVVSWLPQYHDMGLIGSVLTLLFSGGSGFYMSPLSYIKRPALWPELISRYRGTHMQAPNFAYGLTARKFLALEPQPQLDLSCVRHMINAAEPVDTASIDRFYAVFEAHGLKRGVIFPTYGLAEHTVYVCSNGKHRLVVDRVMLETERKIRPAVENKLEMWAYGMDGAGTVGGKDDGVLTTVAVGCGRPKDSAGVDLRIVDTETLSELTEGNVGEIWVTSKSRAAGYWCQPEKTAEDFGGCLATDGDGPAPSADGPAGHGASAAGYLKTGDLGFLWEGELYICGRIKDLIIVRGRNHYPQDVEKTAEAAGAGALRGGCSAAFGTVGPDGGESLAIVAEVQSAGAGFDGQALTTEIRKAVAAEHGASLAVVRLLRPRTIPKTTSGKIARAMCKKAHRSGGMDGDTVFLWGDDARTYNSSSAIGASSALTRMATAETDALAERVETMGGDVSDGGGMEESKPYRGEGGGRGCPTDLAVGDILEGVQFEVAKILKADASAIPTDAPLGALGLDSMEAMQLLALLEERFSVKLPDDVMLEADTTLATLAPIIKSGGVVPERAQAIDCGMLAALEAKEGAPKGYMAQETVQKMQARRVSECLFKTMLETGKFKSGCLSEKVKMSTADAALARSFFCSFAALDLLAPVVLAALLLLALMPLASDGLVQGTPLPVTAEMFSVVKRLLGLFLVWVIATMATESCCKRFPPAGMHSRLRACVMRYLGVRVVVEGKQEPGATYVYVGAGLTAAEQLLLASVAPSALFRPIRPTSSSGFLPSFPRTAVHYLLGSTSGGKQHETLELDRALRSGESACMGARGAAVTASALASAVDKAMRHGAQIVPCAVLGGGGSGQGRFALAKAALKWGIGGRPGGVVVVCARPVRVPFTAEPTPALVMEFAGVVSTAAAKAGSEHSDAFFSGC